MAFTASRTADTTRADPPEPRTISVTAAGASARNGRYTVGTASPIPCRMSGATPMIVTGTGGGRRLLSGRPLGRWRPELEVTTDRTPGTEVHLGESLVHDRRLVPGSSRATSENDSPRTRPRTTV